MNNEIQSEENTGIVVTLPVYHAIQAQDVSNGENYLKGQILAKDLVMLLSDHLLNPTHPLLDVNPRLQKLNQSTGYIGKDSRVKAMQDTVQNTPEEFSLHNLGVWFYGTIENVEKDRGDKSLYHVTIRNPQIANGNTTCQSLTKFMFVDQLLKPNSNVAVDIKIQELSEKYAGRAKVFAASLNSAKEVKGTSLENALGKYDWMKPLIGKGTVHNPVIFREGGPGVYKIDFVFKIASIFHPTYNDPLTGLLNVSILGSKSSSDHKKLKEKASDDKILQKIFSNLDEILTVYDNLNLFLDNNPPKVRFSDDTEKVASIEKFYHNAINKTLPYIGGDVKHGKFNDTFMLALMSGVRVFTSGDLTKDDWYSWSIPINSKDFRKHEGNIPSLNAMIDIMYEFAEKYNSADSLRIKQDELIKKLWSVAP